MSSSYHPQTDGQTERLNQCMETFLCCFVHACPKKWKEWLPVAEFWYNTSFYSTLGRSPFEALFGRQPRLLGLDPTPVAIGNLDDWLTERATMNQLIHQHMVHAQSRMKSQADKKRLERQFSVGDMVYMKLQPYVQSNVMPRANQKLSFKYFGSFYVLEKVGVVAYRLQLPESCHIHPVIHVSQRKLAAGFKGVVYFDLPLSPLHHPIPVLVLQSRFVPHGSSQVKQVLVKWPGPSANLATCEDVESLK
jgi:hypothetical protein